MTDLGPIAQRLSVAVDGRSLLAQPSARAAFWRRAAKAVAGIVKEVEQRADERLAARAEQRASELLGEMRADLDAAEQLNARLDALLENWRVVVEHDHPSGTLSCALCAGYKGAIRDLEKARQPL